VGSSTASYCLNSPKIFRGLRKILRIRLMIVLRVEDAAGGERSIGPGSVVGVGEKNGAGCGRLSLNRFGSLRLSRRGRRSAKEREGSSSWLTKGSDGSGQVSCSFLRFVLLLTLVFHAPALYLLTCYYQLPTLEAQVRHPLSMLLGPWFDASFA